MVRRALSLFLISAFILISCKENASTLDHPELPRHSLHIDGGVQLKAEIRWDNSNQALKTEIRAKNATNDTTVIETGPCAFQILAYTSTDSKKELVWHSQMPEHSVCFDKLLVYQIPPDETITFNRQQNISGNGWERPIPKGEWEFEIHAKSENDEVIQIPANRVLIN